MDSSLPVSDSPRHSSVTSWLGMAGIATIGLTPLLFEKLPVEFVLPHTWIVALGSKVAVLSAMAAVILLRCRLDRRTEPHAGLLTVGFVVLALLFTTLHWFLVDRREFEGNTQAVEWWQRGLYLDILNHTKDAGGQYRVPHQFRALPYGFTRSLELLTGDWHFACLAYRWFFSFWVVWAYYRFARQVHDAGSALLTLAPLILLYALSIQYYLGQLTDPLSHSLFILSMIYVLQDRWLLLAAALALGVSAKETVVVLVPVYLACNWRQGWPAVAKSAALGGAYVAAFLAARVPLGWWPGYADINGTTGLMIETNLGINRRYAGAAPTYMNYVHPLLFVGVFIPFIALQWQRIDRRLRTMCLTLTPLMLFANLCFGWMYESRNYVPLLPLLATMALPRKNQTDRRLSSSHPCREALRV